jgi:hypothetical protein
MHVRLTASVAALFLIGTVSAADLKSGPQKGQSPGAFNPLHATGKGEGNKACLV